MLKQHIGEVGSLFCGAQQKIEESQPEPRLRGRRVWRVSFSRDGLGPNPGLR